MTDDVTERKKKRRKDGNSLLVTMDDDWRVERKRKEEPGCRFTLHGHTTTTAHLFLLCCQQLSIYSSMNIQYE